MPRKKIIFLLLISGMFCVSTAAKERIIADIDGVPLYAGSLCKEAESLLAGADTDPDAVFIRLQAAVLLELKIRITKKLLADEKITVDAENAKWYISQRLGKLSLNDQVGFIKLENDRKFQLKCAIYRYVFTRFPEKFVLAEGEAEAFYRQNQMSYLRCTPGKYLLLEVSSQTPESKQKISDIRAVLLQGADPKKTAADFGASCKLASFEISEKFKHQKMYKNFVSSPFEHNLSWCVAVCTESPEKRFIPFELLEPLIEEELLSRRAGAVFDDILKSELSRKTIKYRR